MENAKVENNAQNTDSTDVPDSSSKEVVNPNKVDLEKKSSTSNPEPDMSSEDQESNPDETAVQDANIATGSVQYIFGEPSDRARRSKRSKSKSRKRSRSRSRKSRKGRKSRSRSRSRRGGSKIRRIN